MTILSGSTRTLQDTYVGVLFEVTVDSSNFDLRLHDGVTPGGHRIANLDSLVQKFQARSGELDGLAAFDENARGLVVRLASATYTVRQIDGTEGEIEVTNGDGLNGNFKVGLPDTFKNAHTFAEKITFGKGLAGNVEGNLKGNVEGKLTGDSEGKHVGDADFRGKTVQWDDEQIPASAVGGIEIPDFSIPAGLIVMWGGAVNSIPQGWAFCDGQGGRPDLRERFVYGASKNEDVSVTGGAKEHNHVIRMEPAGDHTHNIDVQGHTLLESEMPAHSHKNGVADAGPVSQLFCYGTTPAEPLTGDSIDNNSASGRVQGLTSTTGGGQPHDHDATSDEQGEHTHTVESDARSSLPPYVMLAYIIKI